MFRWETSSSSIRRDVIVVRRRLGIIEKIKWRLLSDGKKIEILRSRGLTIGEGCEILNGFDFGSEPYLVKIGDKVRMAGVKITTHDGCVWVLRHLRPERYAESDKFGKVEIGDNRHIGMNAMIMPGVTIGSNCIIGTEAIVTRDIPDGSVAVGVPARVIESIWDYEAKNSGSFLSTKSCSWDEKRRVVEANLLNVGSDTKTNL